MKKVILFFLVPFISVFVSAQVIDSPKSPLDAFFGNWFSDQSGWVLGVYDSVVIADNRIYTCEQMCKRKKEVELALRDRQGGQATTIRLKAGKNGTCRLVQDGKRRELTRSARPAEVISDNGYRTFFHADTATLQGIIDGYNPRLGFNTGMIYLRDIVTGEEDSPRSVYDKFVDEHLRGEACYYLSGKEFNYLRQLFQFNAVPHYEVVEKDGTISRVRLDSNSLRDYLNDRFPLEE